MPTFPDLDMITDQLDDVMSDRIEEKIRDLCLAHPGFATVRVMYRGEPTFVPTSLHPFATVFLRQEGEAQGQEGQTDDTGPTRRWRYDGYISVEVLLPDTRGLKPNAQRKADIPSYLSAKQIIQAAKQALHAWAGPDGDITMDPVTSDDGKETTTELRVDQVQNAIMTRSAENISNVGTFAFHVYTRRMMF
ncbi:MAG: hypothetical protein ACOYB2_10585 [Limnohabitans sp.]